MTTSLLSLRASGSGLEFERVAGWLSGLTALTALDVGYNHWSIVPSSISLLVRLSSLALDGLEMDHVPEWVCGLPQLASLSLADCASLLSVPLGLAGCFKLSELALKGSACSCPPHRSGGQFAR